MHVHSAVYKNIHFVELPCLSARADVMEYKFILLSILLLGSFTVYGESDLSEEDKQLLLQAHNYYRSLAAEDAANMERMVSVLYHIQHPDYRPYTNIIGLEPRFRMSC